MKIEDLNVLVTGGAGFIGSHVAEMLAKQNRVWILDDFSTGCRENVSEFADHPNVTIIEGDIRDKTTVARCCADCDVVFHLAISCLRTSLNDPTISHDINAGGTLNVCEAARNAGVSRFVYVSSSEVYGTALQAPMSETHPLEPITVYGAAKLAGELYTKAFHRTYGLESVIVRPFNTYGPRAPWQGKRAEVIPRFILQALAGQPCAVFGDGRQTRDFTFVQDTARGIIMAAGCDPLTGDVVNIARGREISITDIALAVRQQVNPESEPAKRCPPRPGDVDRHWADIEKAKRLLGFEPSTVFEDGLKQTIEWFTARSSGGVFAQANAGAANW